ncbi:NADH-dependent [FeFe] hydrogenase, group A6 [Marasmitruncus massiliensis]|jgi:NADP-reducing hydrogenase subunit HndD|uniref:NADH-dependent [FeFe] hydrogenase, group A6 n=1 Tax=Marasmitruncus massiliensis TaxID=1944642 RepID=UPI000C795D39|nr:NADH-dependent [FeFe] hydrogenase, group A6 [Marasmitruncus massiliensis]MBE6906999.1 2Fe-2S iron-sulfur cluster binding domain-containing protein [Oscillospiraceae bacterium]
MEMVNVKINGMPLSVPKNSTILEAARMAGIDIPTLCYLKEINAIGACRICVVEVKGARSLVSACVYPVAEGMEIVTNSDRVFTARKLSLELILSTHKKECLSCVRSDNCELQKLCHDFKVDDENKYAGSNPTYPVDDSAVHMFRDDNKCILCRRCVAACSKWQGIGVIGPNERGFKTHIGCAFEQNLDEVACVSCGQCIVVCPTGAIAEKDQTQEVWDALGDSKKHVIVQTAPSIRATLGEAFGYPVGTNVQGKMVAALRRLGFDKVFDTDLAADMTIVEEAHEFVERVQNGGVLPMITSCSPGWVNYCEHYYPDMIPNLSTCKSPQQMFGATAKTWYAEKMGWDPKDVFVVGIMPCTAKKFEVKRPNEEAAGVPDVDVALTTRELARMIKRAGIMFHTLPDEEFDNPLGEATGAAVIFGATGGVMEAALRTAAEWVGGKPLESVDFKEVRGIEGVKEASYKIGDLTVNVAVASGLANAKKVLEKVKSGEANYQFIEIMGCPGGCVNGGGQPVQPASVRNFVDLKSMRAKALYDADASNPLRKSHENPALLKIYEDYFGEFGSHLAHKILHTSYVEREKF